MHEYLSSHPSVVMTEPKETFFFQRYQDGQTFEDALEETHLSHCQGEEVIGEGTTKTMYRSSALKMIEAVTPDPKFICLLRNPIERAWSHYLYRVQHQQRRPTETFSEVIRNEQCDENKALGVGIVELGMYWRYITRLASQFPSERIHVILHSELFERPKSRMKEIFEFLGVDSSLGYEAGGVHNASSYPTHPRLYRFLYSVWRPVKTRIPEAWREAIQEPVGHLRNQFLKAEGEEKPEMNSADREYLRELYDEPNAQLEEWLGRDLSHWT